MQQNGFVQNGQWLKSVRSVRIGWKVRTIGNGAFSGCTSLQDVSFSLNMTEIGEDAFSGCSGLQSALLPDNVRKIGQRAFLNCSSMKTVRIPRMAESIGNDAFKSCTQVTDVMCWAYPRRLVWDDGNCDDFMQNRGTVMHVTQKSLDMYVQKFYDTVNVTFDGDLDYSSGIVAEYDPQTGMYEFPLQDLGLEPGTYSVGYVGNGGSKLEGFGDIERKLEIS